MKLSLELIKYKDRLKLIKKESEVFVFDIIRKKSILLTPEELVRQCVVHYFIEALQFSPNLIQVEKSIKVHEVHKRFDIVILDKKLKPFILIECKRHTEKISQKVFEQVANYNLNLKAPYILVSNGIESFCYSVDFKAKSYQFLAKIPILG